MKYKFIEVTSKTCKEPTWYLDVTDFNTLNNVLSTHANSYFKTYFGESHNVKDLKHSQKDGELRIANITHPVLILPLFHKSITEAFKRYKRVLINRRGGWCTFTADYNIIDTIDSDVLEFPRLITNKWISSIIIKKWTVGTHYYLTSWPKALIFSKDKFDSYEDAYKEALKHVDSKYITLENAEQHIYKTVGD